MKRKERGSYSTLFYELSVEDRNDFITYCRIPPEIFCMLLSKVAPLIEKEDTMMRESIPAGARIEATLRWLANGGNYTSFQFG